MTGLSLESIREAVAGAYAGIRRTTRLEPQGEKIYPPTYEGGEYATEKRIVPDAAQPVDTVLLDSVQSQANRMELALLGAYDSGRLQMPMLQVDFGGDGANKILKEVGRITALEAPHRMCDAIFRDSELDGKAFRQSSTGEKLNSAKALNATPVFELCPTALLFGFWDSTGPRGGLGAKIQRALVSEVVGFNGVSGVRPASRIDPLQIQNNVTIYQKGEKGWTFDPDQAERNKNGEPIETKPSEINHGNITPSLRHEDKQTRKPALNHGGVTISYAEQRTVLSLAALRRLRFPVGGELNAEADLAGRTVIAALGLVAVCLLDEDGYDLRSRCLLDGAPGAFEFVGRGKTQDFALNKDQALSLLDEAVNAATEVGLPWPLEPIRLRPSGDLARLVLESRQRSMAASGGE